MNRAIEVFAALEEDALYLQAGNDNEYGSANALASRSLAWMLEMRHRKTSARVKALALFDGDDEGRKANRQLNENLGKLGIQRGAEFRTKVLETPVGVRKLKKDGFVLSIDLEAYFDDTVWEKAECEDWLEAVEDPRAGLNDDMVKSFFQTLVDPRKALTSAERRRLQMRFTSQGKQEAAKYVARLSREKTVVALGPLEGLVRGMVAYFFPSDN